MTGFPMLFCWIFSYKQWIFYITALTVLSIVALLWFYFRTVQGVLIPLFSGTLSTVWALGFAGYLGFTIDLLMIVVFLLITARALVALGAVDGAVPRRIFPPGRKAAAIPSHT